MKLRHSWFLTLIGLFGFSAQAFASSKFMLLNTANQFRQHTSWPHPITNNSIVPPIVPPQEDKEQLLRKAMSTHAMVQRSWLSSMILPGLGQVYNKHYWKVPCFYLGFILLGAKIRLEHNEMNVQERCKLERKNNQGSPPTNLPNDAYLERRISECKSARNLFIIIISAWYLLNILDAYAGAHGRTVDYNDDIRTEFPAAIAAPPTASACSSAAAPWVAFSFPMH